MCRTGATRPRTSAERCRDRTTARELGVVDRQPASLGTQVAERAAFPKSSAFRYLATLEERRYV